MRHVALAFDATDTSFEKLFTVVVADPFPPHFAWWSTPLVRA